MVQERKPGLAVIFCAISALFFTLNLSTTKAIYTLYPSMSPLAVMFFRAVSSSIFILPQTIYANCTRPDGANNVLSLRNVNKCAFLISIIAILCIQTTNLTMLKKVSVAETSIFCNIGPILTVFIGGIFLADERVTWPAVAKVSIAFIGVTMIVMGKEQTIE